MITELSEVSGSSVKQLMSSGLESLADNFELSKLKRKSTQRESQFRPSAEDSLVQDARRQGKKNKIGRKTLKVPLNSQLLMMSSQDGDEESEILRATIGAPSVNQTEHSILKNLVKSSQADQQSLADQE